VIQGKPHTIATFARISIPNSAALNSSNPVRLRKMFPSPRIPPPPRLKPPPTPSQTNARLPTSAQHRRRGRWRSNVSGSAIPTPEPRRVGGDGDLRRRCSRGRRRPAPEVQSGETATCAGGALDISRSAQATGIYRSAWCAPAGAPETVLAALATMNAARKRRTPGSRIRSWLAVFS